MIRSLSILMVLVLTAGLAFVGPADANGSRYDRAFGTISAIDTQARTMTLDVEVGPDVDVSIAFKRLRVSINSQEATIDDLQVGMRAFVVGKDKGDVLRAGVIRARSRS